MRFLLVAVVAFVASKRFAIHLFWKTAKMVKDKLASYPPRIVCSSSKSCWHAIGIEMERADDYLGVYSGWQCFW